MTDAAAARRILVVDDDVDSAGFLCLLLEEWGFEVMIAHSVATAVETTRSREFDVALIDIRLRDGSGHDLYQRMQAIRPVPAIAVTGAAWPELERDNDDMTFRDYLVKPVSPKKLRQSLDRVFGEPITTSADTNGH